MCFQYRKAVIGDLDQIVKFVDYWATGGAMKAGMSGGVHDFFVPPGRHEKYIYEYTVLLAFYSTYLIAWAVKTHLNVLIHLLIDARFRGKGIGSKMLERLNPKLVRSKFDQSTGNPAPFYTKHGYIKTSSSRVGRNKNIEIFQNPNYRTTIECSPRTPSDIS